MAREMANTVEAITPVNVLRITTFRVVCQRVAPNAYEASRKSFGTMLNTSMNRLTKSGNTITPNTMPAAKTVYPDEYSTKRGAILLEMNGTMTKVPQMPYTTEGSEDLPLYPNLIKGLIPTRANQVWVGDITYVPIWVSDSRYVFAYLSIIMDAYTEEIIGWSLGDTLDTCYPVEALKMALRRIEGTSDICLIHHSDRGCQYASIEYTNILKEHGIQISMTESGDPKDNPQAERINNTVKNESRRRSRGRRRRPA